MKIELIDNKVFFENHGLRKEIHPFWLRERVNGDDHVDKKTQQRLFDPTNLQDNIQIDNIDLSKDFLEVKFNDGTFTKLAITNILKEFSSTNEVKHIEKVQWDSSLKEFNNFEFEENFLIIKKCIKLYKIFISLDL